jgi:hypothetical protein
MDSGTRACLGGAAYHRETAVNPLDKDKHATIEAIMRPIVNPVRLQEIVLWPLNIIV